MDSSHPSGGSKGALGGGGRKVVSVDLLLAAGVKMAGAQASQKPTLADAFELYERAVLVSNSKSVEALFSLAWAHQYGIGTAVNSTQARLLYLRCVSCLEAR